MDLSSQALDGAALGVWEWDVASGELRWDAHTAAIHGIDLATFTGRLETFLATMHPDDVKQAWAAIEAALVSAGPFVTEFRVIRPDGSIGWVQGRGRAEHDAAGNPVRMIGVGIDTTDLRTDRERAARALEHVRDGVAVVDVRFRLNYVNHHAATVLRRRRADLLGEELWAILPPVLAAELRPLCEHAMREQRVQVTEVAAGPDAGWFEVRAHPAPDALTITFRSIDGERAAAEERSRLLDELLASLDRERQLHELSSALGGATTEEAVTEVVTDRSRRVLGVQLAGVSLLDRELQELRYVDLADLPEVVRGRGIPLRIDTPATRAVRTGELVLQEDQEHLLASFPEVRGEILANARGACAAAPLVGASGVVGALTLTWPGARTFSDQDVSFITALARSCAQALERTQAFTTQRRVAETLARALLPERLPEVEGASLAAHYRPAGAGVDVGGDWYDAFGLADGMVGLVVGDVAGHGTPAAAAMGQLRHALRAHAELGMSPAASMRALDHLLAITQDDVFATAVFGVLDVATRTLRWSSAGHPPILRVTADGRASYLEADSGLPLGLDAGAYEEQTVVLAPGDVLVAFSDGLVERPTDGIGAGLDRLAECAVAAGSLAPDELCRRLIADLVGLDHQADDLCILAVALDGGG